MGILGALLRGAIRREPAGGRSAPVALELPALAADLPAARAALSDAYARYVATVSAADMAVSLETASFLLALCRRLRPARVLDLGSGFSSVVFRAYAGTADPRCLVHTVDDDEAWLERTGAFLAREGLAADGLFAWSRFEGASDSGYAVVLHDLGRMPRRAATVEFAVSRRAPDGVLVLDDMHKAHYAPHAEAVCARANLRVLSLRGYTLDRFGRFACLAVPAAPEG